MKNSKRVNNKNNNKKKNDDRDETINHIISDCSKLAQKKYKARHDWAGKVIHWEMCRKFQFDHTNKWYMHDPAPVQENDSHKLMWDFNILLCFHLLTWPKMPFKVMHRKEVTHSSGSYERKSRGRKLADEMG